MLQYSLAINNARLDLIESTTGVSPILQIRSGPPPANCAAVDAGTVLATLTLPADWMLAAAAAAKLMTGTWEDPSADANGTAAHFRIKDSTGTTCHVQGTVTVAGGGGDLIVDNTSFAIGQPFSIEQFTINAGNV